jgi:teichoic acid transport system permease protein
MNRKKIFILFSFIFSFIFFINIFNLYFFNIQREFELKYSIKSDKVDNFQVFYKEDNREWEEKKSITKAYTEIDQYQEFIFKLPSDFNGLRLDFGETEGVRFIQDIYINNKSINDLISLTEFKNQIELETHPEGILIKSLGIDPFIEINMNLLRAMELEKISIYLVIIKYVLSFIIALLISITIKCIKEGMNLTKELFRNRKMIFKLAKNDFKTKYVSSYLGTIWAFINPLIIIGTYWFVFQVGFRSTDIGDVPFIVWFICGIVPWFFFSEALGSATNSLLEYSYLVKKVVFKIEMLPILKILAALFVHLFFIVFLFIIYLIYGFSLNVYNLQIFYYLLCMIVFLVAVSTFTSSIVLFFRDLNQIIGIILNVGFWFTPIGWPYTMLPEAWRIVFKLNPMFYIVEGYRDAFVNNIWFYEKPYHLLYFWVSTFIILFVSIKLFKKLKIHFPDVI